MSSNSLVINISETQFCIHFIFKNSSSKSLINKGLPPYDLSINVLIKLGSTLNNESNLSYISFSKTYILINSSISCIDVILFIFKLFTTISLLFLLNSSKDILFNISLSFIIRSLRLFNV